MFAVDLRYHSFSPDFFVETEELLQTINLQNSKTNHFDSINCKKSLVINGSANSNCSLIDDKQTIQSGEAREEFW